MRFTLLSAGALLGSATAFQLNARRPSPPSASRVLTPASTVATSFGIEELVDEIEEPAALDVLANIERASLSVGAPVDRVVESSFYANRPSTSPMDLLAQITGGASKQTSPLVLIHGFDSSCVEYRRLIPLLEEKGLEFYAIDVLGWGFTDARGVDCTAEAKLAHLAAFQAEVLDGRPMTLVGASLGGAIAIEFAVANPDKVDKLVLIDAQGFIDGAGPNLPAPLARYGIKFLGTKFLRMQANQMAYSDKDKYATNDAMLIGRLHVSVPGWEDAQLSYMCSGGFAPTAKVPLVTQPTLVLWGRQDGILEPETAPRFIEEIPGAKLQWVEDCGHVPHLEQPQVACDAIAEFAL